MPPLSTARRSRARPFSSPVAQARAVGGHHKKRRRSLRTRRARVKIGQTAVWSLDLDPTASEFAAAGRRVARHPAAWRRRQRRRRRRRRAPGVIAIGGARRCRLGLGVDAGHAGMSCRQGQEVRQAGGSFQRRCWRAAQGPRAPPGRGGSRGAASAARLSALFTLRGGVPPRARRRRLAGAAAERRERPSTFATRLTSTAAAVASRLHAPSTCREKKESARATEERRRSSPETTRGEGRAAAAAARAPRCRFAAPTAARGRVARVALLGVVVERVDLVGDRLGEAVPDEEATQPAGRHDVRRAPREPVGRRPARGAAVAPAPPPRRRPAAAAAARCAAAAWSASSCDGVRTVAHG